MKSKLLATLLIAVMLLQVPMALAGAEGISPLQAAIEAGREVSYEASMAWHANPFLDDETNDIAASLLDSIRFSYRTGTDGSLSYSSGGLFMQGEPAITADRVVAGEDVYIDASYLPQPIAVSAEEAMTAIMGFIPVLEEMAGLPEGTIMSAMESPMGGEEAFMDASAEEGMAELFEKVLPPLTERLETAIAGEKYEGEITSNFDVDVAFAMLYELTYDELLDLADIFLGGLLESDAYWQFIIDLMRPMLGMMEAEEELPSDEELIEQVKATLTMVHETIPELRAEDIGLTMYYAECYNDAGDLVTSMVNFGVETEDGPVSFYVEWLPEGEEVFAIFTVDGTGFALEITAPSPSVTTVDSRTDTGNSFSVVLHRLENDEVVTQILIDYINNEVTQDDATSAEGFFQVLVVDTYEETSMGFDVSWATGTTAGNGDVKADCLVDLTVHMDDQSMPIVSFTWSAQTVDPQGAPFDPASDEMEFFRIAAADEAELAAWVEEGVPAAVMENLFKVLSLLPIDVMNVVMGEMGMDMDMDAMLMEMPTDAVLTDADGEAEVEATLP